MWHAGTTNLLLLLCSNPAREGLKLDGTVIDTLIQASQSDLRQVLNMLSTWKLSKNSMTYEDGKQL